MQITFDPNDPQDTNYVMRLLPVLAGLQDNSSPASSSPSVPPSPSSTGQVPPPPPPPLPSSEPSSSGTPSGASTSSEDDASTPERDANGDLWDPEIHASSKAMTQKGTWRKRRGARKPATTASTSQQEISQTTGNDAPPPPPPPDSSSSWEQVMAAVKRATDRGVHWDAVRAQMEMQGLPTTNLYAELDRHADAIKIIDAIPAAAE